MHLTSDRICDQACEGKKRVVFIGVSCGLSVGHSALVRFFFQDIKWIISEHTGSICGWSAGLLPAAP